jgi:hypothetical protein
MFCATPPPQYDVAIVGGANFAVRIIRGPSERNTSLGEAKLAAEEEEDDDKEDKEEMECRQGLL